MKNMEFAEKRAHFLLHSYFGKLELISHNFVCLCSVFVVIGFFFSKISHDLWHGSFRGFIVKWVAISKQIIEYFPLKTINHRPSFA